MIIVGESRPFANKNYTYTLSNGTKKTKIKEWKIEYNGKIVKTNTTGTFNFHTNLIVKTVKLKVVILQNGKEVYYSLNLIILVGKPKILSIDWRDSNSKMIGNRKVGYLDKVKLVIKTINIPHGPPFPFPVLKNKKI